MIEREVIEFVAAVDFTDDCRVEVQMRKRRSTLTVTEAKQLRDELDRAIGEAERGLADLLAPTEPFGFDMVHISPDCREEKHRACIGRAWSDQVEDEVPCDCTCHAEEVSA